MSDITQTQVNFADKTFPLLMVQLRELIYELDAKKISKTTTKEPLIKNCLQLSTDYFEASSILKTGPKQISDLLRSLSEKLKKHSEILATNVVNAELTYSWNQLSENYEVLLKEVKRTKFSHQHIKDFHHIIPINYHRNAFHIVNALIIAGLWYYVIPRTQGLIILTSVSILAISAEIARRYSETINDFLVYTVFKKVARPEERYRVNSATYYITSLTCMAAIAPETAFLNALLILGISDPMANIFGKKFGKTKVYRQKSLVGCIAFFISAFIITYLTNSLVLRPDISDSNLLSFSLILGISGTLIELFSEKLDDNLTIIIGCSLIAWALL